VSGWTVDTVAPQTAIDSGPSGPTASADADFVFSADEGASFQCSVDGAPFAPCSSPVSLTGLAQGAHTFEVRATDLAGNADSTAASQSWTVDTVAPDTTVDSGPDGPTTSTAASFVFSSPDGGTSFQCSLDGAPFTTCTSPAGYTGLGEGAHSFEVKAADAAGTVDATPASRAWTVDTIAPETSLDDGPSGLVASSAATFTFSSELGASFECSLDGAAFGPCVSPATYTTLAEGAHSFEVRARDALGNTDASPASSSWTVDTVAPETTVDTGPSGPTGSAGASFEFSSEPGASFQCSLDGAPFAPCSSPASYTGLAEGGHTFEVRAADAAGNVDPSPA
jgi:hypothetical protein